MTDAARMTVHATAIAIDDHAVLLRGASGSGKSDLALRCLTQCWHIDGRDLAIDLVADDQVIATRVADAVRLSAPATISGLIEVRGIGIVPWSRQAAARLALVVDLVAPDVIERLPLAQTTRILGVEVPLVAIAPFEVSAPMKVLLALARLAHRRL